MGAATFDAGSNHACLWAGTGDSWVDLHPDGATSSAATGVSAGQQVGVATFGGSDHAGLWTGTPGSWVDLHPEGATASIANGVHDGQQAGAATFDGDEHAGLWSGSADSWVDLHPAGADWSRATDVYAGMQVGAVSVDGLDRAGLWSGSADSWEDLSLALDGSWHSSHAAGVWRDAGTVYVVGWGTRSDTFQDEALLWTRPVTCPADVNGDGELNVLDFVVFQLLWQDQDPGADCDADGGFTVLDFVCFQQLFSKGCS